MAGRSLELAFLYFGWFVPRGSPAPTTLLLMSSGESADTTGALRLDPAPVLSHARGARAARQAEIWVEANSGPANSVTQAMTQTKLSE